MASRRDEILGEWKFEEQFVLRVRDQELAERIREILRSGKEVQKEKIEVIFEGGW